MLYIARKIGISIIILFCVGCAQISSHPVDLSKYSVKEVCLQSASPRVPAKFIYILRERLLHHNVTARMRKRGASSCAYRLVYDVKAKVKNKVVYLKDVHLSLYKGNAQIAYADRDAPNGFFGKEVGDLSKWDSMRYVVEDLVDQLFDRTEPLKRSERLISER